MRKFVAIALGLVVAAALATAAGGASSRHLTCADGGTTTKTGDGYQIVYCGSAVATLKIKGKTHIFRGGACFDADGRATFMFSGTEFIGTGGGSTDIVNSLRGTSPFIWLALGKGQQSGLVAYDGPHLLVTGQPNKITVTSSGASGRFTGRTIDPQKPISSKTSLSFSGTWHCNGPIHSWTDYIANVNNPDPASTGAHYNENG